MGGWAASQHVHRAQSCRSRHYPRLNPRCVKMLSKVDLSRPLGNISEQQHRVAPGGSPLSAAELRPHRRRSPRGIAAGLAPVPLPAAPGPALKTQTAGRRCLYCRAVQSSVLFQVAIIRCNFSWLVAVGTSSISSLRLIPPLAWPRFARPAAALPASGAPKQQP